MLDLRGPGLRIRQSAKAVARRVKRAAPTKGGAEHQKRLRMSRNGLEDLNGLGMGAGWV
jgi:hypothetical protein